MPEHNPKLEQPSLVNEARQRVNWLIDPKRCFLLPVTAIWILVLDWLLFSSNLLTGGLATPIVVVLGFFLGGIGTLILQKWIAGDSLWKAILKALVAGIFVGVPWPLSGTLLGGWVLLAAGMGKSRSETSGK